MAQVKIYGHQSYLSTRRREISDAIHSAIMTSLAYPPEKRFHRFLGLADEDFVHPSDRSDHYLIVEISMFGGRSVEAKKALIRLLYENLQREAGVSLQDLEVTIFETPMENWGIRGKPGDELALNYKVRV